VDAYNNTFGGNVGPGIRVADDGRSPGVNGVDIHGNFMKLDAIEGCVLSGADCWGN
jgi:hypothetical protein